MSTKIFFTKLFPFLIIIIIWSIFILPSSFSPCWNYLDDPTSIVVAKSISKHCEMPKPHNSGRYFPAYFLYYSFLYPFFQHNLVGYYLVQALMMLAVMILMYAIVLHLTGSPWWGTVSVFLAATASSVAENIYTLSKAEPKILFYLILLLSIFYRSLVQQKKSIFTAILSYSCIFLLLVIAILTKETAGIIVAFAFTGLVVTLIGIKTSSVERKSQAVSYLMLLLVSLVSFLSIRILIAFLRPASSANGYTTYDITPRLILDNFLFYARTQPDILLLGILGAGSLVFAYRNIRANRAQVSFIVALLVTGWSYIIGQLLWRWPSGYYLLVPAAFFAIVVSVGLYYLSHSPKYRILFLSMLALVLLTRIYSISYFSYIAHAQKAQDKMFTDAINYYADHALPGERLVVEDWLYFTEPPYQATLLMQKILLRNNMRVDGIKDVIYNTQVSDAELKLYKETKIRTGKFSQAPRHNDYVLHFTGDRSANWGLRGVSPYIDNSDSYYHANGYASETLLQNEITWRSLIFRRPFLIPKIKEYSAAIRLYKYTYATPPMIWENRRVDGWMSDKATCYVWVTQRSKKVIFTAHVTEHAVPSVLTIKSAGKVVKNVMFNKAGSFEIVIDKLARDHEDNWASIEFTLNRTFKRNKLNITQDADDLGIRINEKI